jgi:hypothetical protein
MVWPQYALKFFQNWNYETHIHIWSLISPKSFLFLYLTKIFNWWEHTEIGHKFEKFDPPFKVRNMENKTEHTVHSYAAGPLRFWKILQNYFGFFWILSDSAIFCKILQDSARFCKILQDSARFCKILQNSARFCKILQDSARLVLALK